MWVIKGDITSYFGDGQSLGLNITYVRDKVMKGTAKAIKAAEEKVDSTFLMVFGDVYPETPLINSLINVHSSARIAMGESVVATLALTKVNDPQNHAPVMFENGVVKEFWSKRSCWVDMGIMVLEPIIFEFIDQTPQVKGEFRILETLRLMLGEGYRIAAYASSHPWVQIGDHRGLLSLIETNIYFLKKAGLENYVEDSRIENSELHNSSVMKASVLSSRLKNCILYEGAKVTSSRLINCIVDEEVKIRNVREMNRAFTLYS